jgi:multidrug efflux pump subunit AcrA (membrane-fusion protein)
MKAVVRIPEHQAVKLRVDPAQPMRATVKVVGRQGDLPATVTKLSMLSDTMQRWWNPDLKEFPVELTLDTTPLGLKPGSSCAVQILVDSLPDVLTVPVGALYTWKDRHFVWVRGDRGIRQTEVKIGQSNETHVQIVDGLTAGQEVVVLQNGQGAQLLSASTDPSAPPTTSPANTLAAR